MPSDAFDRNALYYLFSTLAQTIAAAVGFLAAFVLLRLSNWDATITAADAEVDKFGGGNPAVSRIYTVCMRGPVSEAMRLLEESRKASEIGDFNFGYLAAPLRTLATILPQRARLLRDFWNVLGCAGATILYALIQIPLVPATAQRWWSAIPSALVAIAAFALVASLIAMLVAHALRAPSPSRVAPVPDDKEPTHV